MIDGRFDVLGRYSQGIVNLLKVRVEGDVESSFLQEAADFRGERDAGVQIQVGVFDRIDPAKIIASATVVSY